MRLIGTHESEGPMRTWILKDRKRPADVEDSLRWWKGQETLLNFAIQSFQLSFKQLEFHF